MLLTFAVSGYRSLRDIVIPLHRLNVITGPNGSGKSSLYRSIRLLADVAQGRAISSLAGEGGLDSTLWAGPETVSRAMQTGAVPVQGTVSKSTVSLKLGFADEDYGYAIDLGLPQPGRTEFGRDPEIKTEAVWAGEVMKRSNTFAERKGPVVTVMDPAGNRKVVAKSLSAFDAMMTHAADPIQARELLELRERLRGWRFYDHFRTDPDAPTRNPQIGTRTPVLASDGTDIAAAIQTILEIGDADAFAQAIDNAFPGSSIEVSVRDGMFEICMYQRGLLRPLATRELSDGTLRYILLVAALLTPRPPSLLVLNEPETSLHPDLLPALGQLAIDASKRSQLIVVSHADELVAALATAPDAAIYRLEKRLGETLIADVDPPAWSWPKR